MNTPTILFPDEGESLQAFLRRAESTTGSLIIVLRERENDVRDPVIFESILSRLTLLCERCQYLIVDPVLSRHFLSHHLPVLQGEELEHLLESQVSGSALQRILAPALWHRHLRSHLQSLGLISLPRFRIFLLGISSLLVFLTVVFWLLPSATITVHPRLDLASQTANIFLVSSGASLELSDRLRRMDLIPITVTVSKSITFDEISKEFIGENAQGMLRLTNRSDEEFSLRKKTKVTNQAGMIFALKESVILPPGGEIDVPFESMDHDIYHEIIGERGNLPAGVAWEIPGLSEADRALIVGVNPQPTSGGTTHYERVLKSSDLEVARTLLEQDLLASAKLLAEEDRLLKNSQGGYGHLEILYYNDLTKISYKNVILPTPFLGESVQSVPLEGTIEYTVFAYDAAQVLTMLRAALTQHVPPRKRIIEQSTSLDQLVAHVIDYSDDLSWIKLTVDLTGKEQFILDPLTPEGAVFARNVRNLIAGKTHEEAMRILSNLPEVEKVDISVWPPWQSTLPSIPSNIRIVQKEITS